MHEIDRQREVNGSGVRIRKHGYGDTWANEHRDNLGNRYHMQDIDGTLGCMAWISNTENSLFVEYVPDDYKNRMNVVREFAYVAMFDRKATEESAFSDRGVNSLAQYLDLCRKISKSQPFPVKFFFIVGTCAPWTMIEVNIFTGKREKEWMLSNGNWTSIWKVAGLAELRRKMEDWLLRGCSEKAA